MDQGLNAALASAVATGRSFDERARFGRDASQAWTQPPFTSTPCRLLAPPDPVVPQRGVSPTTCGLGAPTQRTVNSLDSKMTGIAAWTLTCLSAGIFPWALPGSKGYLLNEAAMSL